MEPRRTHPVPIQGSVISQLSVAVHRNLPRSTIGDSSQHGAQAGENQDAILCQLNKPVRGSQARNTGFS